MDHPIYIIGAGAIGKTLSVFLHREGKSVTLLRSSIDDHPNHIEHIRVNLAATSVDASIPVRTLNSMQELKGIVVLATKAHSNEQLATVLRPKIGSAPVVMLQNGLGVEQPFVENDFPAVYRCVLFATSQVLDAHSLQFKPVSASPIGHIHGNGLYIDEIVSSLTNPYFPFKGEADIQPIIWKKAIINCAFNSICPLLNVDNGVFHREEQVLDIARRVINECLKIANEYGVLLTSDDVTENLLRISRSSDGQLISTLQDINNKRPTELKYLNSAIVELASRLNKAHLVEQTKLLGELTLQKSRLTQ